MTSVPGQMASLLALAQCNAPVYPLRPQCNALEELLPGKVRLGHGWEPPLPLILAAWYETSTAEKRTSQREHIEYADAHDALHTVDKLLRGLKTDEWLVLEEA